VLFVDTVTLPEIVAMPTSDESPILAGKKLDFDELRTEKQKLRRNLKVTRAFHFWRENSSEFSLPPH
jgi:hypothetical protein